MDKTTFNRLFAIGNVITSISGLGFDGLKFTIKSNSSDTGIIKIISRNSDVVLTINKDRIERITMVRHSAIKEVDVSIVFKNGVCLDLTDIRDKDGSRLL